MSLLKDNIAKFAGLSLEELNQVVGKAPHTYKRYYIPKRNGGRREIHHPSKETKLIQYILIDLVLEKLPVHELATAYGEGCSIKENVEYHKDYEYSIRIDFKDFFPSIKFEDFKYLLESSELQVKFELGEDDYQLVRNICFTKYNSGLAIGAPCSPIICNAIMFDFDTQLESKVNAMNPESIFTRYADDIVFSTNVAGECRQFENLIKTLVKKTEKPSLQIHEEKTYYMSRGNRKMIAGLIITPKGKISIGRDKKRYIKKLVFDFKNNQIAADDLKYLRGYLAYILDVEPSFFNSLVQKYSAETLDSIKNSVFEDV
jgi:hypothetical protein